MFDLIVAFISLELFFLNYFYFSFLVFLITVLVSRTNQRRVNDSEGDKNERLERNRVRKKTTVLV